ncbi:MAG: diguanylate cyclase [Thermodesulfovibrionales bacterium]|nr:diguanylate cyclase [Thermodesulfovibrionales bacterium]
MMIKNKTIAIITNNSVTKNILNQKLDSLYNALYFSKVHFALDYIYNSLPDLIILDTIEHDSISLSIVKDIKKDPIFAQIPIIYIVPLDYVLTQDDFAIFDDYIRYDYLEDEILPLTTLCLNRAERVVETNPLSRLPGNITIAKQIQNRLDRQEVFAVAYTDLDFFKPYNDKYGFSRGDEVLKMLGRLILNTVRQWQPQDSFVGHIGGDDFVFICSVDKVEGLAQEIIQTFRKIVPTFYDSEDRFKGYIDSIDREGVRKKFPIMGLSIGIATNQHRSFTHYGEIAEVASEMKKYAKVSGGDCYKIDKRKG